MVQRNDAQTVKRLACGLLVGMVTAMAAGACGGSSPTGPTPTPAPIPAGTAATPVGQTGCSATYACPTVDANGNPNPSTPTFDQVTLSNGTSSSCRVEILSNENIPTVPLEFTVRNPSAQFYWRSDTTSSVFLRTPTEGNAGTSGPFQATARVAGPPGTLSGQTVTDTLTLHLRRSSDNTLVASCGVTVWALRRAAGG